MADPAPPEVAPQLAAEIPNEPPAAVAALPAQSAPAEQASSNVQPMEGVTAEKEALNEPPSVSPASASELKQKERELFGSSSDEEAAAPVVNSDKVKKDDVEKKDASDKEDKSEEKSSEEQNGDRVAAQSGDEAAGGEEAASPQPMQEDADEQRERPTSRRRREVRVAAPENLNYYEEPEPPRDAKISTRPYSRSTYESEASAETVIRYRKVVDEHGKETIETNARLVKWSDGSTQLLIGGTESLAVTSQDVTRDENFLYSLHPHFVLRCQSKIASKLKVVPPEGSKAHTQLALGLQQTQQKEVRKKQAKVFAPSLNPEKEADERIKAENEKIRLQRKQDNKRAASMDKYMRTGKLTANFLEGGGDDGEEEGNIGRIRARFKRGEGVRRGEEEEEEEEDLLGDEEEEEEEEESVDEAEGERRIMAAKFAEPTAKKRNRADHDDLVLEDDGKKKSKDDKDKPVGSAAEAPKRKGHVLHDDE